MGRVLDVDRAFQVAVEAVRQRIREDRKRVKLAETREILEVFERELFASDLQVGSLNPSAAALADFTAAFAATLGVYLQVRRIEVVLFLLDHTDADVNDIAPVVGYQHPRSLTTAVKRVMGHTPMEERRLWREELDPLRDAKPPELELPGGWQWVEPVEEDFRLDRAPELRKALAGGLARRDGLGLLFNLDRMLPSGERSTHFGPIIEWMDSEGRLGSEDAARPLRPKCHEPSSRNLSSEDEKRYLREAAAAVFAVQDRYAAEWTRRPGGKELSEAIARIRSQVFQQGSSLEEMKAQYQVTTTELSRFSPNLGVSPWQYAIETRMEATTYLLCETPMPVEAISWNVGYSEPSQLRRAFRPWSGGLTPAKFRRQAREAARRAGEPLVGRMHWKALELVGEPRKNLDEVKDLVRVLEAIYRPDD